jgi:hypothetical protein
MTTIDEKDFTNIINEFNVYWDMNKDEITTLEDSIISNSETSRAYHIDRLKKMLFYSPDRFSCLFRNSNDDLIQIINKCDGDAALVGKVVFAQYYYHLLLSGLLTAAGAKLITYVNNSANVNNNIFSYSYRIAELTYYDMDGCIEGRNKIVPTQLDIELGKGRLDIKHVTTSCYILPPETDKLIELAKKDEHLNFNEVTVRLKIKGIDGDPTNINYESDEIKINQLGSLVKQYLLLPMYNYVDTKVPDPKY